MQHAFTIGFWVGVSAVLLLPLSAHARSPEFEVASIHQSQLTGLLENYTPTLNFEPGATIRFFEFAAA